MLFRSVLAKRLGHHQRGFILTRDGRENIINVQLLIDLINAKNNAFRSSWILKLNLGKLNPYLESTLLMAVREFFFQPVFTTPPDKDHKTIRDKKVD